MSTQNRRLTFDRIATTEDTDDPVIRSEFPDTGSWLQMIYDRESETIRVAHVESRRRGDMSRMLDEIVTQTGWSDVCFLTPLGDSLKRKLDGFEEQTEWAEPFDEEATMLVGKWDVDR